jgi:hypothetical protein
VFVFQKKLAYIVLFQVSFLICIKKGFFSMGRVCVAGGRTYALLVFL